MTLKELEPQLLALSDNEKVQVVQLLSQPQSSLIQGIEKNTWCLWGQCLCHWYPHYCLGAS
jgi:hypothetical protein